VVDQHTAGAVLYKAYSQLRVLILRNFPGAAPAARASVAAALQDPPVEESRVYNYNKSGSHVHYVLKTLYADTPSAQQAAAWWRTVNLLPDTGKLDDLSAGVLWSFISRRGDSALHLDQADGTCSQLQGKKLWVLVDRDEAAAQHIVPLHVDVMRDHPAGEHRFMAWQQCPSFQWCILDEGDTIVQPRTRLHAVFCIGDVDSVSSGAYCWLAGTPSPLPEGRKRKRPPTPEPAALQPLPIMPARSASSPLTPLARAGLATLVADGQPLAVAAAKVGASQSSAQRWSKRAHERHADPCSPQWPASCD
jgi:hypothetical protein